jgi:hypothetical protein
MLDQITFRRYFKIATIATVATIHATIDVDEASSAFNLQGRFPCGGMTEDLGHLEGLLRPNRIPRISPEETNVGVPSTPG